MHDGAGHRMHTGLTTGAVNKPLSQARVSFGAWPYWCRGAVIRDTHCRAVVALGLEQSTAASHTALWERQREHLMGGYRLKHGGGWAQGQAEMPSTAAFVLD